VVWWERLALVLADASSTAALRETLANAVGQRQATALLFARSDFSSELLSGLSAAAPRVCLLGAGTVGNPALVLTAAGERLAGRAVGLLIRGGAPPLYDAASACRLLAPPRRIETTSDGLVLEVEGMSALDFLSASAVDIPRPGTGGAQPLVLAALFSEGKGDGDGDRFVVRPVRGVDPGRGAIMIGTEVQPGMRLGFAVRDAATAKANLDAMARKIAGQALGAAPEFALFLSCAGRGRGLYGAPDVESRLLRQRFPDVPIAGMHSSFEIVPWAPGEAKLALYTGVLALFRQPS